MDDELLWEINTPTGLFAEAYQSNTGTFLLLSKHNNTLTLEQEDMEMLLKTLNDYQKKEENDE